MRAWLKQWLLIIPGVLLAGYLVSGITYDEPLTLVLVAAVLGFLNLMVRPLLVFFALPFVILTFGIGLLLINALLLYFAGWLVPGFAVTTFGSAFLGSLLISLTNLIVLAIIGLPKTKANVQFRAIRFEKKVGGPGKPLPRRPRGDDVIDV